MKGFPLASRMSRFTGSERRITWAMLLLGGLAGGFGALSLGFTLEWDFLNYHLYNAHALLGGRSPLDVAPAQVQTYLNPLLQVPSYLVFMHWHPAVLVFLTGVVQGAQVALLYMVLSRVIDTSAVAPRWTLWAVSLLGLMGPVFLNQLGTGQADTVLSACVLASLVLVLPDADARRETTPLARSALAGLLLGAAVALKLTFAIYAVGLWLALAICPGPNRNLRSLAVMALGGAGGFLLLGGWWFWGLWTSYGNPLFPFFNQLFESPWADVSSFRDERFLPGSVGEALIYPILWLLDPHRVWEWPFRDLRPVLLVPLLFIFPVVTWARRARAADNLRVVLVCLALSYVVWLAMFSIYRYLAVLEMLAPLALFAMALAWFRHPRAAVAAVLALVVLQFAVDFNRAGSTWKFSAGAATELAQLPADAMLVIDGYEPLGYLGAWVSADIPMVRIRANFFNGENEGHRLHRLAAERIATHQGAVYLLRTGRLEEPAFRHQDLARVGLRQRSALLCRPVFEDPELQGVYPWPELCPLRALSEGPSRPVTFPY